MDSNYPTFEDFVKTNNCFDFMLNHNKLPEDKYKKVKNEIYHFYKTCLLLAKAGNDEL